MTRARPQDHPREPQQDNAADLLMQDDRLPWHIAVRVHLSLALWTWAFLAGTVTLLARILGGV